MGFPSIISSISCFFLLLLSSHLFFAKRGVRVLNNLLSAIFISRVGQIIVFLLVDSDEKSIYPIFYQVFAPFYYLAPACFYLYVIGFVNGRDRLRKYDWLHFIPFILAIIHVLPWPDLPTNNWSAIAGQIMENKQLFVTLRSGLFPPWFYYLGRPFLVLVYLIATWIAVLKSDVIEKKISDEGKKWILFFLRVATFFQLASFFPLLIWHSQQPLLNTVFILFDCILLLGILVFMMHRPKLFYGYLFVAVDMNEVKKQVEILSKIEAPTKKVNLTPEQLVLYAELMKAFMDDKKPYLNANFQILDLANELNIPVHHCSYVINKFMEKNFRDWINSHRITFFISQYPAKSEVMTIEAIAYESGFKTLATFYNAFKKETGVMPKIFLLQNNCLERQNSRS